MVVYNTMYPVDASAVKQLEAHAAHCAEMLNALMDKKFRNVHRRRPRLLWSVQSFNYHHLQALCPTSSPKRCMDCARVPGLPIERPLSHAVPRLRRTRDCRSTTC